MTYPYRTLNRNRTAAAGVSLCGLFRLVSYLVSGLVSYLVSGPVSGLKALALFFLTLFSLTLSSLALAMLIFSPVYAQERPLPPVPRVKPAPPAPLYASEADLAHLAVLFRATDRGNWTLADTKRREIADPVARRLADWAYFRKTTLTLSYQEVGDYLDENSGWPDQENIQKRAERAIPEGADLGDLLAFFDDRPALTGHGKKALASAHIAEGQVEAARPLVSSAWIDHDWPRGDEAAFADRFATLLQPADHIAKIDRQLFEIKATASKRLLKFLPAAERRMAETRIALLLRQSRGITLFKALPAAARQDPGVLHAITRYYRRAGEELKAIPYAVQTPLSLSDARFADKWWTEKKLLARWALKNGYFNEAYQLSAFSGQMDGAGFSEAEFMAGWIALRFLNDPDRAFEHFAFLDAGVSAPISRARAQYWMGRARRAQGDEATARRHFAVAAAFAFTYYGMLAQEEINLYTSAESSAPAFPEATGISADEQLVFDARPQVYAMRLLSEAGRNHEFNVFARHLDDILDSPGEYRAYENLVRGEGKTFLSVRAGKVAVRRGAAAPDVSYPLILIPAKATGYTEPALILGLSRQESEFNPRAFSSAKARGMMQMLPSTARLTARKEGIRYRQSALLDDPSYNLILGAAHLSHLIDRFEGSYLMTLIGYNAGPGRVRQWIEAYGDPRDPLIDPIDWIELIPFSETRNYVMRVLENTQIYRARLTAGQPIAGQLQRDITRGGGSVSSIGITRSNWVLYQKFARNRAQTAPSPVAGATVPAPFGPAPFGSGPLPPAHELAAQIGDRLPIEAGRPVGPSEPPITQIPPPGPIAPIPPPSLRP